MPLPEQPLPPLLHNQLHLDRLRAAALGNEHSHIKGHFRAIEDQLTAIRAQLQQAERLRLDEAKAALEAKTQLEKRHLDELSALGKELEEMRRQLWQRESKQQDLRKVLTEQEFTISRQSKDIQQLSERNRAQGEQSEASAARGQAYLLDEIARLNEQILRTQNNTAFQLQRARDQVQHYDNLFREQTACKDKALSELVQQLRARSDLTDSLEQEVNLLTLELNTLRDKHEFLTNSTVAELKARISQQGEENDRLRTTNIRLQGELHSALMRADILFERESGLAEQLQLTRQRADQLRAQNLSMSSNGLAAQHFSQVNNNNTQILADRISLLQSELEVWRNEAMTARDQVTLLNQDFALLRSHVEAIKRAGQCTEAIFAPACASRDQLAQLLGQAGGASDDGQAQRLRNQLATVRRQLQEQRRQRADILREYRDWKGRVQRTTSSRAFME